MWLGLETAQTNLGVSLEYTVFIVMVIGSIIFMAKDFKLGIILLLSQSAGVFIWFYEAGLAYIYPLITLFICVVILTLTLLVVDKTSKTGGLSG